MSGRLQLILDGVARGLLRVIGEQPIFYGALFVVLVGVTMTSWTALDRRPIPMIGWALLCAAAIGVAFAAAERGL